MSRTPLMNIITTHRLSAFLNKHLWHVWVLLLSWNLYVMETHMFIFLPLATSSFTAADNT